MYSHDGLLDSLTQLAAPALFYKELRRELARADRENRSICLIRFLLAAPDPISTDPISTGPISTGPISLETNSYSGYEEEILNFAHVLTRLSRGEDVCARMGVLEFVCILHGAGNPAQSFISRISASWLEDLKRREGRAKANSLYVNVSSLISHPRESALQLLDRLDAEPSNRV